MDEGELNTDLKLVDISFVSYTDQNITDIAEHAGVTEKALRQYLGGEGIKDGHIDKSCHWITGCYPARFTSK